LVAEEVARKRKSCVHFHCPNVTYELSVTVITNVIFITFITHVAVVFASETMSLIFLACQPFSSNN
jgi:hypothetical protein